MSEITLKRQKIKETEDIANSMKVVCYYLSIIIVVLYLVAAIFTTPILLKEDNLENGLTLFFMWWIFGHVFCLIPISYNAMKGTLHQTMAYKDISGW